MASKIRSRSVVYRVMAFFALLLAGGSFRLASLKFGPPFNGLLFLLPLPGLIFSLLLLYIVQEERLRRGMRRLLSSGLGILLVWNLGEFFYRYFYREHFSLLNDIKHLPGLAAMVTGLDLFMQPAGVILLSLFLLGLAYFTGYLLTGLVLLLAGDLKKIPWSGLRIILPLLLASALLQIIFLPGEVPLRMLFEARSESSGILAAETVQPVREEPGNADVTMAGEAPSESVYAFPGIRDGDVHIFVIESYGQTLFTNPRHRDLMEPVYRRLSGVLDSRGWSIRSGFMRSPAFGGRSWLADATILTGLQVDDQQLYDSLPLQGPANLTHLFEDAGYFRLMAAPGTRQADQEWRSYFRFDRYLFRYDFDYQGPFVSFGAMPDQYLLYRSGELLNGIDTPQFALYILVSSHVPFEVIPEYVPDWNMLGRGELYAEGHLREFNNNWLLGNEYPEGYIAGIEYSLSSIAGYLERYVNDDALVIIIGDHQPRIPISERDSTYSVPVHILAQDSRLQAPLPTEHFSPGLVPAGVTDAHPRLSELSGYLRLLLQGE